MVRLKYLGNIKKKISFTCMGKGYSYVVNPGDIITIPNSLVMAIKGCGTFEEIERRRPSDKIKVVRTTIEDTKEKVEETIIKRENVSPFEVQEETNNDTEESKDVEETKEQEDIIEKEIVIEEDNIDDEEENENKIDYTSFRKKELKDMCSERNLKTNGNRDDLITRLCNYDNGFNSEE